MQDIVLMAPARTPIGNMNGALRAFSATMLGSSVIRQTIRRAEVDPQCIDEVIMGNVFSSGLGQAPARQAAMGAGLPEQADATTVNKVCGSGMKAVLMAVDAVQSGAAKMVVAGGMESMSNVPYLLRQARQGYVWGHAEVTDAMLHDGLQDVYSALPMGALADRCAAKYGIARAEQDDWAVQSYQRARCAWAQGWFDDELVELDVPSKAGLVRVACDERIQKFDERKLRNLPAAFESHGTVTAGNACGMNDGSAAMLVTSEGEVGKGDAVPVARILAYSQCGVPSELYATGPLEAIGKVLRILRMTPGEVDLYEINEPFAVVPLIAIKTLGLDPGRVNVMGGAISLGHPIGASGARILATLLYVLRRLGKRRGIASLCIGGGGGIAVAVELLR
jgi:acetyl-CoA C-acetyltransferase